MNYLQHDVPPPAERRRAQALATTRDWQIGQFRAEPSSPLFSRSDVPGHLAIVFPRRCVGLFRGNTYQLADATKVVLHNPDSQYRRQPLDPAGDECFWYWLADDLLDEIGTPRSVARPSPSGMRFERAELRCSRGHFRRERAIATRLLTEAPDPAELEEPLLGLLSEVLGKEGKDRCSRGAAADRIAQAADDFLAAYFSEAPDLDRVARAVGISKFHLAHTYRRRRGRTVLEKRTELQLRAAYDRLLNGDRSVTEIAMELGFSSPSHFSTRFKQFFGTNPFSVHGGRRS